MSKLLENKQMVHIASEIVVLLGLTFYFNQKNKKMMGHIEDLAQRVEEQEDLLQKHEQIIRKLVDFINQPRFQQSTERPNTVEVTKAPVKKRRKKPVVHHTQPPIHVPKKQESVQAKVSFNPVPDVASHSHIEEYFSEDEEDSDLDAELAEELGELDSDEDEPHSDLKKQ
jgi:hypothetical protein